MWRASCSLALVLLGAVSLAAQGDYSNLLAQYQLQLGQGEPTPEQLVANLGRLSQSFRARQWENPQQRMAAAHGTLGYLNALRQGRGWQGRGWQGNRNLGLGMAGLYRQVGGLLNPQDAWLSYRSSFWILNQLAGRFPQDEELRKGMAESRFALEAIEAKVPELPKVNWAELEAEAAKEYDLAMERYISVSATVTSAEVTAETMRKSLAAQGLAARPEAIAGATRMKLKFEDARRLIEAKRFREALARLEAAEAEARQLLKSFGG